MARNRQQLTVDPATEFFLADRGRLCDPSLQVVPVPIRPVVNTLLIGGAEADLARQTGENGR
jgi:hypothetical protein